MQYDPDTLRVHLPGSSASEEIEGVEEVLTTVHPGTMVLTRSEVAWTPQVFTPGEQRRIELRVPFRLQYGAIEKYTTGLLQLPASFYVALYTASGVYKVYPFSPSEVSEFVEGLALFTGLGPFSHIDHVKSVLSEKLEAARSAILRDLLDEPTSPWIILTPVLHKVIKSLLSGINVYDMERLYHSCRLNLEVTKESLLTLRKAWRDTNSNAVHLRILAVIDRLIDPAVMPPDSSVFRDARKWLLTIQKRLDPFKNQQATEIVHKLLTQASFIAATVITPFPPFKAPIVFDYWDDYLSLIRGIEPCSGIVGYE